MIKINAMIFIIIGIFLTVSGIVFTGIGTFRQHQETNNFQDTITGLSRQTSDKQNELSEYAKKNVELAEELAKQTIESKNELIELSNKNAELTTRLTDISEERFKNLTKPSMNVVKIEEVMNLGVNSYFKILVKNTGNNDCLDAHLLVDRHNSPFAKPGSLEITNITKVPKDGIVEYRIPIFQSNIFSQFAKEEQKEEFQNFLKRYKNNENAIVIFFHIEYKWNNERLKSSQYTIVKSNDRRVYSSTSEDYVEPEVKLPEIK